MLEFAAVATLLLAAIYVLPVPSAAQPLNGPMADQVTFIEITDEAVALNDLEAGGHDIRIDSMRGREAQQAAVSSPNLETPRGTSAFWNLKLNPVPRSDGVFNPFTIREIREAMNWLIDRQFVADELYGGLGFPHISLFHAKQPDYGRLAAFIAGIEAQYAFDPEKAEAVITQAMTDAGATKVGGLWMMDGNPVTINFVIRTSPVPRTRNGEYMAGLLEDLGFTVTRDFKTGSQASPIVYSGIASDGLWQAYTEGWGSTAMTLWSQFGGYQFFQWPAFSSVWNEHAVDPVTDQAITDWFLQTFNSEEEREELIKTVIAGTIQDSTRVWLVAETSMFVNRADIDLVHGLAAGFNEMYTIRSASRNGQVGGPESHITASQFEGFVGGWNPIGITWLFDRNIEYAYRDPGAVWPNPHTGKHIPLRANWVTETAGPTGTLDIPADATVWNMAAGAWEAVAAGATATSKVTYTYDLGSWHHGMPVSVLDMLNAVSVTYRLEDPDGDAFCVCHEGQFSFFQSIFKGLRVVGDPATSNEVEVWLDYWHWDEGEIAGAGDIWATTPYEIWEMMLRAYKDSVTGAAGTAFLEEDAVAKGWEWMNQAFGPSVPMLKIAFDINMAASTIPMGLTGMITATDADARYAASLAWYNAHQAAGNAFQISNGPFWLTSVDIPTKTVVLTADRAGYPLPANQWQSLLNVRIPEITLGPAPTVNLDVGAVFSIGVSLFGEPYDDVSLDFIVLDPAAGAVLFEGQAVRIGPGSYEARLTAAQTATLVPGAYELRVIGVGVDAAPPVIVRQSFLAFTVAGVLETLIKETEAALKTDIAAIAGRIDDFEQSQAAFSSDIAGLSGLLTVVLILAVIAIATSAVTVLVIVRRTPAAG